MKALSIGIYLGAAGALGRCLGFRHFMVVWTDRYMPTAILSVIALVFASFLALTERKYAYAIGFVGTLLAWPLMVVFEVNSYNFSNSWLVFDIPAGAYDGAELDVLFAKVTILTIALLVLAAVYSLLRLCPYSWRIGRLPVQERTWLAFIATLFVMVTWYVTAASPWRNPILDAHSWNWNARLCVLHVEKRGFRIREISVAIRQGRNIHITRDDRKLFQYAFQEIHSDGAIPEGDFLRLQPLIYSPAPFRAQLLHYVPPKLWNADRWFVYSQGRPIQNLFNVDKSAVPPDVLAWFIKAQSLDELDKKQITERDVCLGFCYDPTY